MPWILHTFTLIFVRWLMILSETVTTFFLSKFYLFRNGMQEIFTCHFSLM